MTAKLEDIVFHLKEIPRQLREEVAADDEGVTVRGVTLRYPFRLKTLEEKIND